MINLLHAELFKLRKSKTFKISLLVTSICALILLGISYGNAAGKCNVSSGNASGLSDVFIMSVIGALMAGVIICADFESKDIHDEIPCGRFGIVVSKSIIYSIIIMILVLPYGVISIAGFISGNNFDQMFNFSVFLNVMSNKENLTVNSNNILKALLVVFTTIVVYAARLSICIPIAFKVRKSVIVTAIAVIFGFVIDLILGSLKKVSILKPLEKVLPYNYAQLSMTDSIGYMVQALLVSIVFIFIMIIISHLLFRKSEIK